MGLMGRRHFFEVSPCPVLAKAYFFTSYTPSAMYAIQLFIFAL